MTYAIITEKCRISSGDDPAFYVIANHRLFENVVGDFCEDMGAAPLGGISVVDPDESDFYIVSQAVTYEGIKKNES